MTPTDQANTSGATAPRHRRDGRAPSETEPGLPPQAWSSQPWDQDGADIDGLIRPMLEALAKLTDMEATYLTVFDWDRREEEVRFVFAAGWTGIQEGQRLPLPEDLVEETFSGVTRSPTTLDHHPQPADGQVARRLGLATFVSVPVTPTRHRLFGMLCGASKESRAVSESVVGMFESFAAIVEGHLARVHMKETEQRAAAAEAHLRNRTRFLAEAEHRIKTPLTVLQGMSLTLRDRRSQLSGPARTQLEQGLVRNVLLLSQEIDGLLAEAGADIRSRTLSPVDSDLADMVGEIARAFDGLDTIHHVVADASSPLQAFVDPTAVYQILSHLVDNAIKYSPEGGLITIRAVEATGFITIEVVDNGVGLPPAVDVFEAFRRGTLQDRPTPGIGLGLHIVRTLVEAMNGTVTARSNPDAGSTFTVILPAGDQL